MSYPCERSLANLGQNTSDREKYIENCRRGGVKGQEALKRKKNMQALANTILELKLTSQDDVRDALRERGVSEEDATIAAGILFVQAGKAMKGDTEAARFVRDTSGQKPVEGVQIGNLEDRPFETLNLAELTDDELRMLAALKEGEEE